jgi:hypothetical protein
MLKRHLFVSLSLSLLCDSCFHVSLRYQTVAKEVITSVQKIKESLSSLKKLRKVEETDDHPAVNDDDKILLQLSLDIKDYVSMVRSISQSTCCIFILIVAY